MYRNLRTRNEAVHNMKSMVGTKVESVPKLHAGKLRLSSRKRNRLKELVHHMCKTCVGDLFSNAKSQEQGNAKY
jgi:hypothetical protein